MGMEGRGGDKRHKKTCGGDGFWMWGWFACQNQFVYINVQLYQNKCGEEIQDISDEHKGQKYTLMLHSYFIKR